MGTTSGQFVALGQDVPKRRLLERGAGKSGSWGVVLDRRGEGREVSGHGLGELFVGPLVEIHAAVRPRQETLGIGTVFGTEGRADANVEQALATDCQAGADSDLLDLLELFDKIRALEAGEHQNKLISPHASDIVVLPAAFLQTGSHKLQDLV